MPRFLYSDQVHTFLYSFFIAFPFSLFDFADREACGSGTIYLGFCLYSACFFKMNTISEDALIIPLPIQEVIPKRQEF